MDGNDLKRRIADKARELGFAACGFARARGAGSDKVDLARFLALGRHGDMGWMADVRGVRGDAAAMWPEAKTAVCLGANYAPTGDPRAQAAAKNRGWIAAYAKGRDYHDVLKKRLKTLAAWIAVQVAMIGLVSWMQPACLAAAGVLLALLWRAREDGAR